MMTARTFYFQNENGDIISQTVYGIWAALRLAKELATKRVSFITETH
jgi:hypothetical protein